MRTFDDFEKNLLRQLKLYYERGLLQNWISLLDNYLENKEIRLNRIQNSVIIGFDYNINNLNDQQARNLIGDVNKITIVIVKTIFLLQYLEKSGYVFLFNESGNNLDNHSRIVSNNQPIPHQISDPNVCKLIIEYFSKTIVISQAIVDLVNDDFISKEEQRHNESIRISTENLNEARNSVLIAETSVRSAENSLTISRYSLGFAIIIGIASILISIKSIRQSIQISNKPILIDTVQYEKIINRIDTFSSKLILQNQVLDLTRNNLNDKFGEVDKKRKK